MPPVILEILAISVGKSVHFRDNKAREADCKIDLPPDVSIGSVERVEEAREDAEDEKGNDGNEYG